MNIITNNRAKSKSPKLLEQVIISLRANRFSKKTEEAYLKWIKEFINHNGKRHPKDLTKKNVGNFLTHLAVDRKVSASTQNQALSAVLYLYKNIIKVNVGWLDEVVRANRSRRLPVVFSKSEVKEIFNFLEGVPKLVCSLLYGSGLRLGEALRLRIKDVNFEYKQIIVREAKGDKDRITTMPVSIIPELKAHLNKVYLQHKEDLKKGKGKTKLPYALAKKYPNADKDYYWQYVFPADKFIKDKETGLVFRYHVHESTIQKVIKNAVRKANILKHGTAHTFRHLPHEINNLVYNV